MRVKNQWQKGKGDEKGKVVKRSELISYLHREIEALGSMDALIAPGSREPERC